MQPVQCPDCGCYWGNERVAYHFPYCKWVKDMTDSTDALLSERGKMHGDFGEHADIAQYLKAVMAGKEGWARLNNAQHEALDMIAHKIGRILAGDPNFRDHWDDIAGYARLVAERCPK